MSCRGLDGAAPTGPARATLILMPVLQRREDQSGKINELFFGGMKSPTVSAFLLFIIKHLFSYHLYRNRDVHLVQQHHTQIPRPVSAVTDLIVNVAIVEHRLILIRLIELIGADTWQPCLFRHRRQFSEIRDENHRRP